MAVIARKHHDAVERRRHLDHAEDAGLLRAVKRGEDIEDAVPEVRERVPRIYDQRRDDRGDLRLEALVKRHHVGVGQVLGRHMDEAMGCQRLLELLEGTVMLLEILGQKREQRGQLLGGRHVALVVGWLLLQSREVRQAADTDHEPLVEVRGEDRDELEALEERHGWVEGLIEDAVVEAQPAHLAVLRVGVVALALAFAVDLGLVVGELGSAVLEIGADGIRFRCSVGHGLRRGVLIGSVACICCNHDLAFLSKGQRYVKEVADIF